MPWAWPGPSAHPSPPSRAGSLRWAMYTIVRRAALSPSTFLWEISAADVARACQPGQFVMVRLHDGSERIPLTIADYDRAAGTVTVVVQALGKSTREMADRYHAGDSFDDFVGPLGLPHPVEHVGHAAFVGGGLGVAPVYPLLRAAKQAGNRTSAIVGFRSCRPRVLGGSPGGVGRRAARVHRRWQLRPSGSRHRCVGRPARVGPPRPRRRHRPAGHDAGLRRGHRTLGRADDRVPQHDHGRRHRHVRLMPGERRWPDPLCLRRRAGVRRARRSTSPS